jgi:hypothetical protein
MQVYTTKDPVNLLQLLHTARKSGELFVRPLEWQNGISWQAWFQLLDGQIVSCLIRNEVSGQILLRNHGAMHWLFNSQHGNLEWMLKEATQTPAPLLLLPTYSSSKRDEYNYNDTLDVRTPIQYNEDNSHISQVVHKEQLEIVCRRTVQSKYTPTDILSSREQLQIFSLVNGHRTAAEIARLLHKSPDVILHVLNDLHTIGLIEG